MLEECNPVTLVLVLMLALVGQPSTGARGSKNLVLLAFLLSIRLLRNYEHSIILEWATQGNDDVTRSLAQRSCFCSNRGTWVLTHEKHQETKDPFPSHTETEFRFQDTKTILSETPKLYFFVTSKLSISKTLKLSVSETPKRNSVSTPLKTKFCFHSSQNKILFPLHSKQNSVSGLHYSINPNTLLWYNDTHHCANHLTRRLLPVIVIWLLPFTLYSAHDVIS